MRRLESSFNEDNVTDAEIEEVYFGSVAQNAEVCLKPRDHGERVMIVGFTSTRLHLVEIGIEDQDDELVVFHARKATKEFIKKYEEQTHGRL